ncbi:hypothetical protein Pryu01_02213 [Paraliobacillus ryukyuensis]|uniref:Uncharacterized protein n=1 Tax=Paraliobacillus ryukyuensis TaxID=200904 RepID=A0A366E9F2_9BACI|nr:RAxF-45 family protein [Paraliobacillus ryukyuensis]RBO98038.1 hypothetical protein DES48_10659 [Paraliobacillus ryukyuensis]
MLNQFVALHNNGRLKCLLFTRAKFAVKVSNGIHLSFFNQLYNRNARKKTSFTHMIGA